MSILIVAAGGALGASLRYGVGQLMQTFAIGHFPYATLLVNIVGSFFMGYLAMSMAGRFSMSESWRLFLLIGVLGGFTTFSSFSLETVRLWAAHLYTSAILNVIGNVVGSIAALLVGLWAAR